MAKLRVLGENPPPPRGNGENQLRELRDYLTRMKDELEFLLTHLGEDNLDGGLTEHLRRIREQSGQISGIQEKITDIEGEISDIDTALSGKQDTLTFDDAPTASSSNPVKSGGVHTGLQRKADRNLLRNWYFPGGGTGAGIFPVNTRGQASYTGGYCCDGWYGRGSLPVSLTAGGLQITATAGTLRGFTQSVDSREALVGKKVTASILLDGWTFTSDSDGFPKFGLFAGGRVYQWTLDVISKSITGAGLWSVTGTIPDTILDYNKLNIALHLNKTGGSATIVAAKLELGDEQTLAHRENGVWVLNEIPDYEQELIRCATSVANAGSGSYDDPNCGKVIAYA